MKTIAETKEILKKVENLYDFQNEFYFQDLKTGNMLPNFELMFKNGENYTCNPAAREFDRNGNCTNVFIKCSDGFVEYPF